MDLKDRLMFALKPASWPKIILPAIWGQAVGWWLSTDLSFLWLILGGGLVAAHTVLLLFYNDLADYKVDQYKRSMFPQSSLKTLPDGILNHRWLFTIGVCSVAILLAFASVGLLTAERNVLPFFVASQIAIVYLYSSHRVGRNYLGGGEFLEAIGVGFLLPWTQAYMVSGVVWHFQYSVFLLGLLPSFASALASGLADEESDRKGGKSTFVSRYGNPRVHKMIIQVLALSPLMLMGLVLLGLEVHWLQMGGVFSLWLALPRLQSMRALAGTNQFEFISAYKSHLHRSIWTMFFIMALGAVFV